jgi:endogenous inhibitor of DNA gyrase (YacG/DUF329 family)
MFTRCIKCGLQVPTTIAEKFEGSCSKHCHRRIMEFVQCEQCGETYELMKHSRHSLRHFCSRDCYDIFKDANPPKRKRKPIALELH